MASMSARYELDAESVFVGVDYLRPRFVVEQEKLQRKFPNRFNFYGRNDHIASVQGTLRTNSYSTFQVCISIPDTYPTAIPTVTVPSEPFPSGTPHRYSDGSICLMRSEQWSQVFSLAFLVAKTAVWLHKYEAWKRTGEWKGREQRH